MADSKYERLPHAGDFEREGGTEILYLSPLPIPTGVPAFSSRNLHREANAVYLDFAVGQGNFEFMARCGIAAVMGVITTFMLAALLGAWARRHVYPFWGTFTDFMGNWFMWSFIGCLALLYAVMFWRLVREVSIYPPIRFNRERREVAFVPTRGAAPIFVPWESVIACVSAGRTVTEYAVLPAFNLMFCLREADTGNLLWINVPCGQLGLAVAEWEAIRVYMEEGPASLPVPPEEQFEEGTVAFFHMARVGYRDTFPWWQHWLGFLAVQAFGGWTLPCHISQWANNRPKAGIPREVKAWSRPLPLEQHARPSPELLAQSEEVSKALRSGKTLLDYFKVKFGEPAATPDEAAPESAPVR
ncbi:hypothetical protein [Pseudomonas aegrilactucae]|nr:hypothetical protein [Pseudomonas aegrilactucae]